MNTIIENKQKINALQTKLNYIENKIAINKKRKTYKIKSWKDTSEDKKRIQVLQMKLRYIRNKEDTNKKRKTYKRQAWSDRADNPKNMEKVI